MPVLCWDHITCFLLSWDVEYRLQIIYAIHPHSPSELKKEKWLFGPVCRLSNRVLGLGIPALLRMPCYYYPIIQAVIDLFFFAYVPYGDLLNVEDQSSDHSSEDLASFLFI